MSLEGRTFESENIATTVGQSNQPVKGDPIPRTIRSCGIKKRQDDSHMLPKDPFPMRLPRR